MPVQRHFGVHVAHGGVVEHSEGPGAVPAAQPQVEARDGVVVHGAVGGGVQAGLAGGALGGGRRGVRGARGRVQEPHVGGCIVDDQGYRCDRDDAPLAAPAPLSKLSKHQLSKQI